MYIIEKCSSKSKGHFYLFVFDNKDEANNYCTRLEKIAEKYGSTIAKDYIAKFAENSQKKLNKYSNDSDEWSLIVTDSELADLFTFTTAMLEEMYDIAGITKTSK